MLKSDLSPTLVDLWVAFELADGLALAGYEGTATFPREEMLVLTSLLRRVAVSVASNVVEIGADIVCDHLGVEAWGTDSLIERRGRAMRLTVDAARWEPTSSGPSVEVPEAGCLDVCETGSARDINGLPLPAAGALARGPSDRFALEVLVRRVLSEHDESDKPISEPYLAILSLRSVIGPYLDGHLRRIRHCGLRWRGRLDVASVP